MTNQLPKIDGHSIVDIRTAAAQIVEAYVSLPMIGKNGTGRKAESEGGFLTILGNNNAALRMRPEAIGLFLPEKKSKYYDLSLEKGRRLFGFYHHQSSHQSRHERSNKWGGAIRAGHLIVSFSGLPELGDEAVCLVLAVHLNWLSEPQAKKIAALSNNKQFGLLLKQVKQTVIF